jgi:putative membrane-bound dehydrogenase-like protein
MRFHTVAVSFALAFGCVVVSSAQEIAGEHSVDSVIQSFRLADSELRIEPAATEPNVVDPVSVTWDEDGRMYVVEMRDYPDGASGGTVRRLVDSDRDGAYESATLFAEGLSFPTSAIPWNGGIIVAAAPDLLFLKDTNDDGVADERRVLFTGFGQGLPQHQINSMYWGTDAWVYASNGGSDGSITVPGGSSAAVSIAHRDIRFRPDTGVIEPTAGFSQNGSCLTEWGDRLVSSAASPFRQVVAAPENASVSPAPGVEDIPILEWFDSGRIWPISPPQQRFSKDPVEYFNAACGLAIYNDRALPAYDGNAFVCEPVSNLVHRRVLAQRGSVLIATRGESGFEFLASSDPWFRPVSVATGPDGALYIVDFCRQYLEHPSLAPDDVRATLDWRAGDDLGRIWRVRPKNWDKSAYDVPALSKSTPEQLVGYLEHASGWVRRQAQRLLVEKRAADTAPALKKMAASATRPEVRVSALWTLDALGAADEEAISTALGDTDARIRKVAVRTAEPKLRESSKLAEAVSALAEDPGPIVRYQVALAAASMSNEQRLKTCRTLAGRGDPDAWLCAAILRSAGNDAWPLLDAVFTARTWDIDWWTARNFDFAARLAEQVGASGKADDITALLAHVAGSRPVTGAPDIAFLSGLSRGLARGGQPLKQLLSQPPAGLEQGTVAALNRAFTSADELAHHKDAGPELRAAAIRLLIEQPNTNGTEALLTMLKPDERPDVVNAIVRTLGESGGTETNQALLERWAGLSKEIRGSLVQQFLAAPSQTTMLLDAIESGAVLKHEIELASRETLLNATDPAVHDRAAALYPDFTSPAKADLYASYSQALQLSPDPARGAKHFAMNCFPCHQVNGIGNTVGPQLTKAKDKPKEYLMHSILDPSSQVLPEFIAYTISTKNFEDYAGLMVKQDAGSVTLRAAGGLEQSVQRSDIETMTPGALSLMPEGLEAALDKQAMADLLEFIKHPDMDALKKAVAEAAPKP